MEPKLTSALECHTLVTIYIEIYGLSWLGSYVRIFLDESYPADLAAGIIFRRAGTDANKATHLCHNPG